MPYCLINIRPIVSNGVHIHAFNIYIYTIVFKISSYLHRLNIFFMTECRGNTFGIDCKQICGNCKNGEQCHEVNGSCPNGCNEGATGVNFDIGI